MIIQGVYLMAATFPSPNAELRRLLKFSHDDLQANYQGQMTLQQRVRLLENVDGELLGMICLIPVCIALWAFKLVDWMQPLIIASLVLFTIITAIFRRGSLKYLQDCLSGKLLEISGVV